MSRNNIPHNFDEDKIDYKGFCCCFSHTTRSFGSKWDKLCLCVKEYLWSTKDCISERLQSILSGFDNLDEDDHDRDLDNKRDCGGQHDKEHVIDIQTTHKNSLENTVLSEKNEVMCEFCSIKVADVVILPCGHSVYCNDCLEKWYETCSLCPKCKVIMSDVVQCI